MAKNYTDEIIQRLLVRGTEKTLCPSELLEGLDKQNLQMMEEVRQSAHLLAEDGIIEITQRGVVLDPQKLRGPIRLRLKK